MEMNPDVKCSVKLPSAEEILRAVRIYIDRAYDDGAPERIKPLLPPEQFDPATWLMSDTMEREPRGAALDSVRSFVLRLGNFAYPHMKLRLSRPPHDRTFMFCVDSHDAFLKAPEGSADRPMLEDLKKNNAAIAADIISAWDAENLPTERNYLRRKIRQARNAPNAKDAKRRDDR